MNKAERPEIQDGPANWLGSEMKDSDEWRFHLSDAQIDEVKIAVRHSIENDIEISDINASCFELPTLGAELKNLYQDVINGRGFFVGDGLPVEDFSREEVIRAWIGIGTHLGDPLPQNAQGHIIGHVKDLRRDPGNKNQRTFGTSERQPYHTDNCDIVGLLCLKTPKAGGLFSLTSSYAVYNEMLKRRPDLLKVLEQSFVQDRRGEVPEGKQDIYEMAAFYHHKGRLMSVIDRNYVNAGQAHDSVPRLTRNQVDALDMLEVIAEDEKFYLDLEWSPGTFAFVHNHQMFHSRTAYEDYPEIDRMRHNLRLWLSARSGWELHPQFEERYDEIEVGKKRGGIILPGIQLTTPMEAE
jgi:hypothetical protein